MKRLFSSAKRYDVICSGTFGVKRGGSSGVEFCAGIDPPFVLSGFGREEDRSSRPEGAGIDGEV